MSRPVILTASSRLPSGRILGKKPPNLPEALSTLAPSGHPVGPSRPFRHGISSLHPLFAHVSMLFRRRIHLAYKVAVVDANGDRNFQ
jgi:hypothetical protein